MPTQFNPKHLKLMDRLVIGQSFLGAPLIGPEFKVGDGETFGEAMCEASKLLDHEGLSLQHAQEKISDLFMERLSLPIKFRFGSRLQHANVLVVTQDEWDKRKTENDPKAIAHLEFEDDPLEFASYVISFRFQTWADFENGEIWVLTAIHPDSDVRKLGKILSAIGRALIKSAGAPRKFNEIPTIKLFPADKLFRNDNIYRVSSSSVSQKIEKRALPIR